MKKEKNRSKSPCVAFYPADFFGDVKVRVMTPDAKAYYALFLLNIWEFDSQYSIPDDDKLIAGLLQIPVKKWVKLKAEILPCLIRKNGVLVSPRLKREKDKSDKYRKAQAEKGKKSAQQRLNRGSTPELPEGQPEGNSSNSNSNSIKKKKEYSVEFVSFWAAYPNRVGKDAAWKSWQRRSSDRPPLETILTAIEDQKAWRDNAAPGEFRPEWKSPSTWINQGCWADEVKSSTGGSKWFSPGSGN